MSKRAGPLASQEINDAIGDAPIGDASIDREDAWVRGVMSEHAPAISGLLRCRYPVFNAEDIEDVVIIAMARLWKARDRFDAKKASLKTFLFRIADNVARDVVKSGWYRARSREVLLDESRLDESRLDERGWMNAARSAISRRKRPSRGRMLLFQPNCNSNCERSSTGCRTLIGRSCSPTLRPGDEWRRPSFWRRSYKSRREPCESIAIER